MRIWIIAAIATLFCCPSHAQTFVQAQTTPCGTVSANSYTCSYPSNTTSGNTGFAVLDCNNTCVSPSITSTSNTWVLVASCTSGYQIYIFEADNITAAMGTVTFHMGATGESEGSVLEYSGLASSAIDKQTCAANFGSSLNSGATATTTQAHELVMDLFENDGGAMTLTDGTTSRFVANNTFFIYLLASDRNVTTTGTQTATSTTSTGHDWSAMVATFKAASAASGHCGSCDLSKNETNHVVLAANR